MRNISRLEPAKPDHRIPEPLRPDLRERHAAVSVNGGLPIPIQSERTGLLDVRLGRTAVPGEMHSALRRDCVSHG